MNATVHPIDDRLWPPSAFSAAVLRDLDGPARAAVSAAGCLRRLGAGDGVYCDGDPGESFYVVLGGAVALRAVRRGDTAASLVRVARQGDTFGEEATLPGFTRRTTAICEEAAEIAEIPVAVFRRVTGRAGGPRAADRERRLLHRAATADLLATMALSRDLRDADLDILLDAAQLVRFERAERIFSEGDAADALYLVAEGLVQAQTDVAGRPSIRGYVARGDFFGDEPPGAPREVTAVASGDSWCLAIPATVVRTVHDRNPHLFERMQRLAGERQRRHDEVVEPAAAQLTRHVFRDLYRMQMARSLLVIDQDTCVRCGHCSWSCSEVHGTSRLVRRGDQVVAQLGGGPLALVAGAGGAAALAQPKRSTLLLPSSCQQCRHASCMIDCPTGAIARDVRGEVFVRAELCTGCGNCAKACPWENIQMAPRPAGLPPAPGIAATADIAVKCDLCHGFESPACVQSCPTGSILRIEPARDFAEVSALLGAPAASMVGAPAVPTVGAPAASSTAAPRLGFWTAVSAALGIAVACGAAGLALHHAGRLHPNAGAGLAAGWLAGLATLALAAYAVPKRLVRLWMTRLTSTRRAALAGDAPPDRPLARSRVRPWLLAHIVLGVGALAAVTAHAGARLPASPAGLLHVMFWVTALVGGAGTLAYRLLPARLTRLERRGALPEDLAGEREVLLRRLYREATGTNDLIKAVARSLLVPYAQARLGWVALVAGGRDLAAEEKALRAEVDAALAGRGGDRLAGLDDLVRTVVELRALPARRALTALLRGYLPIHVIAAAMAVALLGLHVFVAVIR